MLEASPPPWPGALALGACGAIFAALVWATVSIFMQIRIGYLAVGLGWLSGTGVVRGSGGQRGVPWMVAGGACGLLGFSLGWYIIAASVSIEALGLASGIPSYFRGDVFLFVLSHMQDLSTRMDPLWLMLSVGTAAFVPRERN